MPTAVALKPYPASRVKPLLKKYGPAIKAIDEKMCEIYEDAKDSISGAKEKLTQQLVSIRIIKEKRDIHVSSC